MNRILVALDGSSRAPVVLRAAVRLAEISNAKLIAFRAIGIPPDLPGDLLRASGNRLEAMLLDSANAELKRMTEGIPADRVEKLVASFATPWDGICRTAKELDADLIVIGSHGFGGIDRLLGTTAAKVVNHAERNVLVVRGPL